MARISTPEEGMAPDDSAALQAFSVMMRAERGGSADTLSAYRSDLTAAARWMWQHRQRSLLQANYEDLVALCAAYQERGLATSSIARKRSSLRQWYDFLLSEGYRADDPTLRLSSVRKPSMLPRALPESVMTLLLDHAARDTSPEGVRFHVLLELAYGSGLRVSELVGLKCGQLSWDRDGSLQPYFTLRGKGSKERVVPLTAHAVQVLQRWLDLRRCHTPDVKNPWLFPSYGAQAHLTRQRVGQLLKQCAREAGLCEAEVAPHRLRHSFATHLLAHGADVRTVQTLLGHSDLNSTQRYTTVADQALVQTVQTLHPLAKIPRR